MTRNICFGGIYGKHDLLNSFRYYSFKFWDYIWIGKHVFFNLLSYYLIICYHWLKIRGRFSQLFRIIDRRWTSENNAFAILQIIIWVTGTLFCDRKIEWNLYPNLHLMENMRIWRSINVQHNLHIQEFKTKWFNIK